MIIKDYTSPNKKSNSNNFYQKVVSGGMAGIVACTTIAPIDRIKINSQTSYLINVKNVQPISMYIRNLIKSEGIVGFWKGNAVNCLKVMPYSAIQFSSYDFFKQLICTNGTCDNFFQSLSCGALVGFIAVSITHPLDLIKVRLQTSNLKSARRVFTNIYNNGISGFYRGYTASLISHTPFNATNFCTFDYLRSKLDNHSTVNIIGIGAMSGLIAQTLCYPLDTIRRRMQLEKIYYTSTKDAIITIIQTEGIIGFYRGILFNALSIVPNNAIRFFVFDYINKYITSRINK